MTERRASGIETRPVTIPVHLEIRSEGVVLVQPEMSSVPRKPKRGEGASREAPRD